MPKVTKTTKRYYKKDKYSIEQRAGYLDIPASSQAWSAIVAESGVEGMRKVKHLTVSLASQEGSTANVGFAYWALVYVPQGTQPNTLSIGGATMYEPNQFVMNCGVADFSGGPLRFTSPISRNLNSGDKIILIMTNGADSERRHWFTVRYAICYN